MHQKTGLKLTNENQEILNVLDLLAKSCLIFLELFVQLD